MRIELGRSNNSKYLGIHPELSEEHLETIRTSTDIGEGEIKTQTTSSGESYSELSYVNISGIAGVMHLKAAARQIAQVLRHHGQEVEVNETLRILGNDRTLFEEQAST